MIDPADPAQLETLLKKNHIELKHSLGQNFLVDPDVRDRVAEAAGVTKSDEVLEVGAGVGTLTVALAPRSKRLVAVEIDRRLIRPLRSVVGENSHVQIRDSLVTISGYDPMPMWSAGVQTNGTLNYATYSLSDSANPVGYTWPIVCSSKAGNRAATFGYAPSVHETISSFVVEGATTAFTNGSLDISFP